jgi:hypothetical protein
VLLCQAAPLVRSVRSLKLELFALRQQEAAYKALLDQVAGEGGAA